jgi:nucleoside-diphosphate-sugar epimerase
MNLLKFFESSLKTDAKWVLFEEPLEAHEIEVLRQLLRKQKRDFVFVGDINKTLLAFYKNNYKNGIYNLGSGKARSFNDLASAIASACGMELKIKYIPTPEHLRSHYQYFTEAQLDRLRASGLNFKSTNLEDGVRESLLKANFELVS